VQASEAVALLEVHDLAVRAAKADDHNVLSLTDQNQNSTKKSSQSAELLVWFQEDAECLSLLRWQSETKKA
jgi:hypothetical protein